jgi:hypothetical protein
MKLAKLCIIFFFALSSFSFSYTLYSNTPEQAVTLNEDDDYTIIREYHDGLWWLVYYNADGLKIMEIPDPWQ